MHPVDLPTEQNLVYRAWVASRRAYVERASGGRVGYVHIPDMGEESLRAFNTDLDVQNREKDGVVVDVRNNKGGFVDPYVVDVLTRREGLRFRSRFGFDPPERTSLGQRALDKPSVLVVNEHSLSDAENFTEGYRAMHPGPVVGEPTAGWIIFTRQRAARRQRVDGPLPSHARVHARRRRPGAAPAAGGRPRGESRRRGGPRQRSAARRCGARAAAPRGGRR